MVLPKIIDRGKSQEDTLLERKAIIQKRLDEFRQHGGLSESQTGFLEKEIQAIDKKLQELKTPKVDRSDVANKFNMAEDKIKSDMEQQNMQNLTPEQIMQILQQKQAA